MKSRENSAAVVNQILANVQDALDALNVLNVLVGEHVYLVMNNAESAAVLEDVQVVVEQVAVVLAVAEDGSKELPKFREDIARAIFLGCSVDLQM